MSKDWTGNQNSIYKTLGASNHCDHDREENDFYATQPKAVDILFDKKEGGLILPTKEILEPCAGKGHISEKLKSYGYNVTSYDLIDRGYCPTKDFFDITKWDGSIVTNPPYKIALDFIKHSLEIIPEDQYVCMFLKLTFLEGKARKKLFTENPPEILFVSSSRLGCLMNANLTDEIFPGAVAYGWYCWKKGFKGNTIIKWIN